MSVQDYIDLDDKVEVIRYVIGQDRKLIHSGDYVRLRSEYYKVITQD